MGYGTVKLKLARKAHLFKMLTPKETIHRKSEDQQKVLKFKKTSPFSQNLFIESKYLNGSTAPLATISVSKRFYSERL